MTASKADLGNESMSNAKAEARKAADAALGNALRAAADHIYWYDGADAAKFDGGPITIDEFAGGVKLADRFDLTEIANAAIDAYAAALEKTHELVPREPTEAMLEAGWFIISCRHPDQGAMPRGTEGEAYRAMIAAAEPK